jgi:hypothetical protein
MPERDWARHSYRILNLIDNQVRSHRESYLVPTVVSTIDSPAPRGITLGAFAAKPRRICRRLEDHSAA